MRDSSEWMAMLMYQIYCCGGLGRMANSHHLQSWQGRRFRTNIANFYPPVEGEVIVNNALILFPEALSDMVPNGKREWTPRQVFSEQVSKQQNLKPGQMAVVVLAC